MMKFDHQFVWCLLSLVLVETAAECLTVGTSTITLPRTESVLFSLSIHVPCIFMLVAQGNIGYDLDDICPLS